MVAHCVGGTALLLGKAATPEQSARVGDQTGGRLFLFLQTDDFWRDYHEMHGRGVRFAEEPRVKEYGPVAVFLDLYGNRWDLAGPRSADASGGRDGRGPAVNLANAADQSGGYGERELPSGRRKDVGFVALSGSFQNGQQPDPEHPTANLNLRSGGVNSTSQNDTEKVAMGWGNSAPRIRRLEVG